MSYLGTGAFRATGKTDDLFAVIAQLRLTYPDQGALKEALNDCVLVDGVFGFDIANWKWYSSYSSIQTLEHIMHEFRSNEENFDTCFVRIGEDDTDVEVIYTGDGCDLVRLVRTYEAEPLDPENNLLSSTIEKTRSTDDQELVPLEAG
jgi:hypothetical protein